MDPHQGPPQPDLLIGQTIGNYLVTQKLGEGGMGSVYLAEHPSIGKKVALKVLHSEFSTNQEVAARFFHEAKAVNDIGHPNIVDIVDFGIIQAGTGREQLVYFIMEYLAGLTLSQLIRAEAPLPPERALTIALQVADALAASHKCGIVHRDLKPDNIILMQRGRERDFVKLLDFGIAKLTGGSAMGSHRTRTGIVMGTPAYMSPEQCEGRDSVDQRTDIYALGIVMYEMLTGRVPFVGSGYGEILVQHLTQPPVPLSQYRMLPPHVEVVVLKALEKRADMRYPTMEEFMRAMADAVGYVEAHGGVTGFLQRQLMPSMGPIPSGVRLTPPPPLLPQMTPLPGTLVAPGMPTVTTTLGSSTGQMALPRRSPTALIIAGAAIVTLAVAAIVIVALRGDPAAGPRNGPGDGSSVAKVDSIVPATPTVVDAGAVDAAIATIDVDASAEVAAVPDASVEIAPDAKPSARPASTKVQVVVHSTPSGAKIYIDGAETGKSTPASVPLSRGQRATISLRLRGYTNYTFKALQIDDNTEPQVELEGELARPRSTSTTSPPPNRGSATRPASTPGSRDPDDLMKPE